MSDEHKVYVGNVSYSTTEDDLRGLFEEYGEIDSAKIITDRESGRSKGFGFVGFKNHEDCERAIESLNGQAFQGRNLTVNHANRR